MKTKLLRKEEIQIAAEYIQQGKLVAFPTETVYGLGGNALDPKVIKKIFQAKQRPADNPLIVHVASEKQVKDLVKKIPLAAKKLMHAFWPGPLSIVFEKSKIVPKETTAGLNTVVIRMPDHKVARKLIELSGIPLAAPSANRSGKPSPTRAKHVVEDLSGRIHAVLDAGSCKKGLESTVIDVRKKPFVVLRLGSLSLEQIEKFAGPVVVATKKSTVRSPGMKYKHYAPDATLILVKGEKKIVDKKIRELATQYKKAVILKRSELKPENLFKVLRSAKKGIVLCPSVPEIKIQRAVMDRLEKAASEIITV